MNDYFTTTEDVYNLGSYYTITWDDYYDYEFYCQAYGVYCDEEEEDWTLEDYANDVENWQSWEEDDYNTMGEEAYQMWDENFGNNAHYLVKGCSMALAAIGLMIN